MISFFSLTQNKEEYTKEHDTDHGPEEYSSDNASAESHENPVPSQEHMNTLNSELQSELAIQLNNNDQASLQIAIAAAGEEAGASNMQMFTQKGVVRYRIMQALGEGPLNTELAQLEIENKQIELVAQLRKQQESLRQEVKDYVEEQFLLFSKDIGKNLRDQQLQKVRLSNIDFSYYQEMNRLVKKAAKQLASLHSRRRKTSKRGLLDVRKTIAANAAYDGFLFHTKWKSTRIEKTQSHGNMRC